MNILVTADPELPVPPRLYGGIERVIALLVNELHARGHRVGLVAHRDSSVPVELTPYTRNTGGGVLTVARNAALIASAARALQADVVHSFSRLAYLAPLLPRRIAKVMSYQRSVTRRTVRLARQLAGDSLVFAGCSGQLIRSVESEGRWHVVYNALDTRLYEPVSAVAADAPLVFLGRIEPIKGTHVAIDVARQARRRLVIAGNVPAGPDARDYFRAEVEPHIDGRNVTYVGAVDDEAKNRLLGGAAALLMPILWDEPFGIVMIEAMACGTPVVGLRRGSVPEVVADSTTGFVCDTPREMVEAVGRLDTIDRRLCRRSVDERFSASALVNAYESVYQEVVNR